MKRSLTLLLASLFLVFSLTACGGNGKNNNGQNGNDQNNSAVTGDTAGNNGNTNGTTNNGNAENGTTANGDTNNGTTNHNNGGLIDDTGDVLEDIGNGTRNVLDDAGRALTGNNGTANRPAANGAY